MKNLFYIILAAGIISSCNMPNNSANEKMAKNEARFQAFYDQVFNAHNVAMLDSFVTTDFVDHQAFPGQEPGLAGLKKGFADYFAAFPDIHAKINFMISKGDTMMAHVTFTGTNSGPMMGMPATNKSINVEGVDIIAVNKDGKATEHWGYQEEMKRMTQLGMMPPMGAKPEGEMKMDGDKK